MCNTEQLVSYVYQELSESERVEFESHLSECAGCRQELAELRGSRQLLASWTPPQPEFNFHIVRGAAAPSMAAAPRRRFAFVPQWALSAAAALLLFAGAAALANLEVRYGQDGLVVRTGWSTASARVSLPPSATSRCEVWSRPPCETGWPRKRRVTVTKVVSKMGMRTSRTGTASTAVMPRE